MLDEFHAEGEGLEAPLAVGTRLHDVDLPVVYHYTGEALVAGLVPSLRVGVGHPRLAPLAQAPVLPLCRRSKTS